MRDREMAPFHTTHWSLVDRAGHADPLRKRKALTELLRRYLPALKSHLMFRKRLDEHRAEDLLQSFLYSKVLEEDLISRAQRERGRFRTFLLTALDRFLISEIRKDSARKRSADSAASLDAELPVAGSTAGPDEQFELTWARQVLAEALKRMELECNLAGRMDVWGVFQGRIMGPLLGQEAAVALEELAARHLLDSTAQVSNLLVTAKRTFARSLRSVVGEYEMEEQQIEEEMADLRRIFARRAHQ